VTKVEQVERTDQTDQTCSNLNDNLEFIFQFHNWFNIQSNNIIKI
jgi:hypothetical protein